MKFIISENKDSYAHVISALVGTFSKIFRVNINSGEFEVFKHNGIFDDTEFRDLTDIYAYMERLITDGFIYPEYATACRRFTNPEYLRKSVFSGERRIVQSYRRRTPEGDKWVTFAVIAEPDCSPENPMVLFTWREADTDAITLLDTLPTVSSLYNKLIRINLSNNTYEPVLVDADEQGRLVGGVINMYEWWASYSKDGYIADEDMASFSMITTPGILQKHFAEDPTPVSFRYRRKVNDEFRWVKLEIAPSVEYSEDNQVMLLSLKDIHEEYLAQSRSRQELIDNMSRDALTNLFNRLKFKADIGKLSDSSEPFFICLYIDVNGLHELNNHLGHQKGDDMLCCVADTLVKYFPDENVYRIGGDEFVVTSTAMDRHAAELNMERVRRDLRKDNYEISVGIASGTCGSHVEKLVAEAELAMRNDKSAYYMRNGDRRRKRQMNEELEQMLVEKQDNERFLNIIANQFAGVYLVDTVYDTLRHIFIPDFFSELLEETDSCFSEAMRLYVERFVKQEYHALFEDILDFNRLKDKLSEKEAIQFNYQKTNGVMMNVRILELDKRKNANSETIWIIREES